MSVGSGVVVSQFFGAEEKENLKKAVHNTVALSIAGGILFWIAGYFLAPGYLDLMNTPEELKAPSLGYLRIYFCSFLSMFLYNLGSGVLRALGDARSPLYAQFLGGIANVAADYIFIRNFENGIEGVAWATVLSQTLAAVVTLCQLSRLDRNYAFRIQKLSFDRQILKEVLSIGIPAGAQSLVIT